MPTAIVTSVNVARVLNEGARQIHNPPSKEKPIGVMWDGFLSAVVRHEPLVDAIQQYADGQTILTPSKPEAGLPVSEINNKVRVALAYDARSYNEKPLHSLNKHDWLGVIGDIAHDDTRFANFLTILNYLHIPTTVQDRYGAFEVVRQLWGDPTGKGIDWWEGGSSVQLGAKATQLKQYYPFLASRVVRPVGGERKTGRVKTEIDRAANKGYKNILGRTAIGGDIIGTDIWRPDDRWLRQLAIAALRPSELADDCFMERFTGILEADVPNIGYIGGDITDEAMMRSIRAELGGRTKQLGFLGTVLNQVGQEKVMQTIDNALGMLHDDGVLFILEFGNADPNDPTKFQLASEWSEWTYRLCAVHNKDPQRRIQPLLCFKNSRMTHVMVEDGLLDTGGGYRPMRDYLVDAA
ncbi:MAG TPA: hypothetical protein VLE73_02615 [Candidatus Saccharimonadales bacterium]|nr:hypothetical protein [Candidatus Saccharimonadales bacterium]